MPGDITHQSIALLGFHQGRNGFKRRLLVMVTAVSSLRDTGERRQRDRGEEEREGGTARHHTLLLFSGLSMIYLTVKDSL